MYIQSHVVRLPQWRRHIMFSIHSSEIKFLSNLRIVNDKTDSRINNVNKKHKQIL